MFPHLDPDASWSVQQEAGDRLRAIYSAGARERQTRALGPHNVHLGNTQIMWTGKHSYQIGLDYAMGMGRGLVVYRAMAREDRYAGDRLHYIQQALRLRGALCWWGLDPKMRTP